MPTLTRRTFFRHFAAQPTALGPWLEIDPAGDNVTGAGQLLRTPQRPAYAIPASV